AGAFGAVRRTRREAAGGGAALPRAAEGEGDDPRVRAGQPVPLGRVPGAEVRRLVAGAGAAHLPGPRRPRGAGRAALRLLLDPRPGSDGLMRRPLFGLR